MDSEQHEFNNEKLQRVQANFSVAERAIEHANKQLENAHWVYTAHDGTFNKRKAKLDSVVAGHDLVGTIVSITTLLGGCDLLREMIPIVTRNYGIHPTGIPGAILGVGILQGLVFAIYGFYMFYKQMVSTDNPFQLCHPSRPTVGWAAMAATSITEGVLITLEVYHYKTLTGQDAQTLLSVGTILMVLAIFGPLYLVYFWPQLHASFDRRQTAKLALQSQKSACMAVSKGQAAKEHTRQMNEHYKASYKRRNCC